MNGLLTGSDNSAALGLPKDEASLSPLLVVARQALENHLAGRVVDVSALPPPLDVSCGVFVTLWASRQELRGCIGHMAPVCSTLAEEVAQCAISAATEDGRFAPVTFDELARIHLEISILHPLEVVANLTELDAKRYGVMVSSGWRRGVLLPDIEGVDTPEQQISICRRKGGIGMQEAVTLERFLVTKVRE